VNLVVSIIMLRNTNYFHNINFRVVYLYIAYFNKLIYYEIRTTKLIILINKLILLIYFMILIKIFKHILKDIKCIV
jgi:hypothetical protein